MTGTTLLSTDDVAPRERAPAWREWVFKHFGGLESDLYGDTEFDGHMAASRAGDVILTKLEANRHRVLRSPQLARTSESGYLKIVAPWRGSASVEQQGRAACARDGGWVIYDTTGSYNIANPERSEHLIVMLPKEQMAERGVRLDQLMARHVGGASGISRVALETMRSTYQELPNMSEDVARGAGELIMQLVRLSLLEEMKLPYFFLLLQQPAPMTNALVDMLKANGAKSLAVIYVDDLFGLENYSALKVALQGSGINLVEEKSYPAGVKDLSPVLRSIKDKNPDAFVGFTYPPDTILASKQAKEVGLNPKFFYASVGTAFQLYRNVMTPAGAEGVLGMGSWNAKSNPAAKAYFDAHTKKFGGKEPDRWASGACWAGMEILTAGVNRVGLDRKALRDYIAGSTHKTIMGDIKFTGSENTATPGTVSQWQNGEFEVVWPQKVATAKLNPNKPAWK